MTNENCTFFENTGAAAGPCNLEVCRCNDNICSLRLDFNTFNIAGPSTSTVVIGKALNGQPATVANAVPFSSSTRCLTDTFTVTVPGGPAPPEICGLNTGEHSTKSIHVYTAQCGEILTVCFVFSVCRCVGVLQRAGLPNWIDNYNVSEAMGDQS